VLWREDPDKSAGESRLQVSDGIAWRNIPVVGTLRKVCFIAANQLRSLAGSSVLGDQGTYPNKYSYVSWAGNSSVVDGVGCAWVVPSDYAPSTSIGFKVLWSYDAVGSPGTNWVCEGNVLACTGGVSLLAGGTPLSSVVSAVQGAVNAAFYTSVGQASAGVAAGTVLRISLNRNAPSPQDSYSGTIRLVGLIIEYSAGI
jgi:hypothetical protein